MKIIRNAIRCKNAARLSRANPYTISNSAHAAHVPLTEDTNIYADAVSSRIGKSWRRPKKLMTTDFA